MILLRSVRSYVYSISILLLTIAALSSGCMWGIVTDADTGAPVANAVVGIQDSMGNARFTSTNALGVYVFGPDGGCSLETDNVFAEPDDCAPARGPAVISVTAAGEGSQLEKRTIDYLDNPNASLDDPASFRDVQNLKVPGDPGMYRDTIQGYTIKFPDSWSVGGGLVPGADAFSSSAQGGSDEPEPNLAECQIISYLQPPGGLPSDWWLRLPSSITVIKQSNVTIAGRRAINLVVSVKAQDNHVILPGDVEVDWWVFQRGPQVWEIQCMTHPDAFASHESVFAQIAESFKFEE